MESYSYLIRTVIVVLASIGQVEYRMHNNFVGFYREEILFAKLQAEELYILNDQGTFAKTDKKQNMKDELAQAYNNSALITKPL